jgi:hypothetical protein
MLKEGKANIRTGHESQGEDYMYIYTLSLTSELDSVEKSTPRTARSIPQKDTR